MFKRNLIANYIGQGWAGLMGLAFIPLYIQYLGIEAFGLIGLFTVLQAWLSILDMGMSPTLGREMARFTAGLHTPQSIRNLLRSLEIIVFGTAGLVSLAILAGSRWLAEDWLKVQHLDVNEVSRALAITALVIGLRFCEGIYRSAIIGLQKQVWFNGAHMFFATLRYAGVIPILAFVSPTIGAFFMWQAAISLLAVATYAMKLHRLLPSAPEPARLSRSALSDVWRFAGGMMAINFLAILLTQVDKVLLSRLLNLEDYGYYTLAATVAGGLYLVIGPITQAIYPRLVELHAQNDEPAFAHAYHQGAQLVTLAITPIMLLVFFFPESVLYLWSGDARLAERTAPILAPLIFGTFLNGLMWMPYHCQLAYAWTSLGIKINSVAVCMLVPVILWLVPIYGAIAAAWLWVALNLGYALIGIHFMHKRVLLGEKLRWYYADIIRPIGGAIVVIGLVRFLKNPGMETGRLESGLLFIGAGMLAFIVSLVLSNQVWPMVRARLSRIESGFRQ